MARVRIGLSPIGVGRLIAFAIVGIIFGVHQLGVAIGLIEPSESKKIVLSEPPPQSLGDRDAEVRRIIAARDARAKQIRASEGN